MGNFSMLRKHKVVLIFCVAIVGLSAIAHPADLYKSKKCGISFKLPVGWSIKQEDQGGIIFGSQRDGVFSVNVQEKMPDSEPYAVPESMQRKAVIEGMKFASRYKFEYGDTKTVQFKGIEADSSDFVSLPQRDIRGKLLVFVKGNNMYVVNYSVNVKSNNGSMKLIQEVLDSIEFR